MTAWLDEPLAGHRHLTSNFYRWETPMSTPTSDVVHVDRPNPLAKAANSAGVAWASLSGIVGGASTFGLLTAAQAASINQIGEALPGWILAIGTILGVVVPAIGTLIGSFRTAAAAKPDTTPMRDPRDHDGTKLVRADGLPLGGR